MKSMDVARHDVVSDYQITNSRTSLSSLNGNGSGSLARDTLTGVSNKSNKSGNVKKGHKTDEGVKILDHSQVYREIFEAEVQLANAVDDVRYARANKPPPKKDQSTKKVNLPVVRNIPPGGPNGGLISENGKHWVDTAPNEMRKENPVLIKQVEEMQRAIVKPEAETEELEMEVMSLPDKVIPSKVDSDIMDRVTEKRKAKHNRTLEELHQKLSMMNQKLEPRISETCAALAIFLKDNDRNLDDVRAQIESDEQLVELTYQTMTKIWSQAHEISSKRKERIEQFSKKLHDLEDERVATLRKVLSQYSEILERVSHLAPGDVHKVMDNELLLLNQSLISNQRDIAELTARLQLECIDTSKRCRVFWENKLARWKELLTTQSKEEFRHFMEDETIANPPEIVEIIKKLQDEQRSVNEKRIQLINSLEQEFIPPKSSKTFVYQWNEKVLQLTKQLDGINQRFLKLIYEAYESVSQKCLAKMQEIQSSLVERFICDDNEVNNLAKDYFLPLVGETQQIYEARMTQIDRDFEHVSKQAAGPLKSLFKFILGVSHLWDKHELALDEQERKLQERLETGRQTHTTQNQEKEAQLDALMDRMRQEASEQGLKEVLKKSLELLDKIKTSYTQFHTHQVHTVKSYPGMVTTEVGNYEKSLLQFFGVKKEKPIAEAVPETRVKSAKGRRSISLETSKRQQLSNITNAQRSTSEIIVTPAAAAPATVPPAAAIVVASDGNEGVHGTITSEESTSTMESASSGAIVNESIATVVTRRVAVKKVVAKGKTQAGPPPPPPPPVESIYTRKGTCFHVNYDEHGKKLKPIKKEVSVENVTGGEAGGAGESQGDQHHPTTSKTNRIPMTIGYILPLKSLSDEELLMGKDYLKGMQLTQVHLRNLKKKLREMFLNQSETWREEAMEKARLIVTAKCEELEAEMQLRMHLHDPRPRRAEMDVHNVRAAELILHSERVARHCKGVAQTLNDLRGKLQQMQSEHDKMEVNFHSRLEEMEETFTNASKSSKLTTMSNKLNLEVNNFMNQIRTSLQHFRQKADQQMQMLTESNSNFIRSFKLFSEGGNFCPEEVEDFRKRLEKMAHRIEQSEAGIMSELEGMEKKRQDSAIAFSKSFEDRFKNNLMDLVFMEKITRWFTNTQLNIKSEVSDSNSQSRFLMDSIRLIESRIDAVRLPNVDKENISAEKLNDSLLEVFQSFHDRAIYLNCVKAQLRPLSAENKQATGTTGGGGGGAGGADVRVAFVAEPTPISKPGKLALDDPSIAVIRGILKSQKARVAGLMSDEALNSLVLIENSAIENLESKSRLKKPLNQLQSAAALSSSSSFNNANSNLISNLNTGSNVFESPGFSSAVNQQAAGGTATGGIGGNDAVSRRNSITTEVASVSGGKRTASAKGNKYVAKNQRLDKKYLIFGEGDPSLSDAKNFLGRIKEICRVSLDGMLYITELYYRQKGSRPVTRPHIMQDSFEACAEAISRKLQSFYQQAEEYHNNCNKEFYNQLVNLEKLVKDIPQLVLEEGMNDIVGQADEDIKVMEDQMKITSTSFETRRLRIENMLRPDLGHPQKSKEISQVAKEIDQRHQEVLQSLQEHRSNCEAVVLRAGQDFVKMIGSQSEQLLLQFDNLLTADDIERGRNDPQRYRTSELLRRKYHGQALEDDVNATLIVRGKQTWKGVDMKEFLSTQRGGDSFVNTTKSKNNVASIGMNASPAIITAKTTMGHNATITARDQCIAKFRTIFKQNLDEISAHYEKSVIMENRWNESLLRSVESIVKLHQIN